MKYLLFICLLGCATSRAEVVLPSILASDMVLQQETDVALWGWANPTEKVTIAASWNTTPLHVTCAEDAMWKVRDLRHSARTMIKTQWAPAKSGWLFNGMVSPVTSFAIAGVIWYQGESNRHYPPAYYQLMHLLVESWRGLRQQDFPFYYVQLAPYRYGGKYETALLRENQTKAMDIPKSGMVVTTDLVDNLDDIHPAYKKVVGNRLAN